MEGGGKKIYGSWLYWFYGIKIGISEGGNSLELKKNIFI